MIGTPPTPASGPFLSFATLIYWYFWAGKKNKLYHVF